jgi:hypothetical protein
MKLARIFACCTLLVLTVPLFAWHEAGHRAIGAIAFNRLEPAAKQTVTELLQSLPDPRTPRDSVAPPDPFTELPPTFHASGVPVLTPATLDTASVWPDKVRGTWLNRPDWHYIDMTINGPGGHADPVTGGKAVDAIPALVAILRDTAQPKETRAMALAWIAHLVGDLHQPLHAVAYFDTAHPTGDKGGNSYFLDEDGKPTRKPNLHSFWDGIVGEGPADVPALMERLKALPDPEANRLVIDISSIKPTIMAWARESLELARSKVYRLDASGKPQLSASASQFDPATSQPGARDIADGRVQLAGFRLAALLNSALK